MASVYSSAAHPRSLLTRNKMSITQTYYLAHTARRKLASEAERADHDLRLLVGHANLLDSLMLDLANAEKEQERWFNNIVRKASSPSPQPKKASPHIRWADTVEEESVDDDSEDDSDLSSDSDDDSDYDSEDFTMIRTASAAPIRRAPSPVVTEHELSDAEVEDDLDDHEEAARLTLTRSPSRKAQPQSPPELLEDTSSDSEEESMPPSPTNIPIDAYTSPAATQGHPAKRSDLLVDAEQASMFDHGYLEHQGTMIPAY